MNTFKRIFVFFAILGVVAAFAGAQSQSGNREMSVEESYLQESIELMIIREQSRAESREMKLVALTYIGEAIDRGNTGEEIRAALEYLGTEGIVNQTRENGRLVNNYPDIRTKAASYLGDLGTSEAKDALIKMCLADNEPMVLTEVVKSLAKIGINDNDETANTISWIVNRFDVLHPDNQLALSALEAYEKLAEVSGGIKDPSAVRTIIRIAEGNYIRPVQDRAKQLLIDLRKYNAQSSGR
jgi:HEAT repeat protein